MQLWTYRHITFWNVHSSMVLSNHKPQKSSPRCECAASGPSAKASPPSPFRRFPFWIRLSFLRHTISALAAGGGRPHPCHPVGWSLGWEPFKILIRVHPPRVLLLSVGRVEPPSPSALPAGCGPQSLPELDSCPNVRGMPRETSKI